MNVRNIVMGTIIAGCAMQMDAQNTTNSDLMTPETLWSMHRLGGCGISPDGKQIAYQVSTPDIKANKSHSVLFIMDSNGSGVRQLSATDAPNQNDPAFFTVGGIQRIAFIQGGDIWSMKTDGSDVRQHSRVGDIEGFLLSPDGSKVVVIRQVPATTSIQPKEADLPLATGLVIDDMNYKHWDQYVQTIPHIFIADLSIESGVGEMTDILDGEPYECPVLPFGGTEQLCWSPDGNFIAYTSRKKTGVEYAISTDTDIYYYDVRTHETRNLCKTSGEDQNMGYDMDPLFSPDGKKIAWRSMERNGYESDRTRLCVLDMEQNTKTYVTESFQSGVESFVWGADSKSLYFSGVWQARQSVYSTNLSGNVHQIAGGDYDYGTLHMMPNGKQILINRHSISAPDDLFTLTLTSKNKAVINQITNLNKDILDRLALGEVKQRMVATTDGKQELCWVIYPPHFDPNHKYPTLLFCEGGPQSPVSQFWSYRWNFQIMAANGYIIIAPNRRGLPGFGMDWLEEISGDYSGQCMQDYLSAIDDICKESYVDKDKLGCVGASFGGYSVYWLAGNHNKRFKAFIAHDGIFNTQQQYYETEEMWFPNWDLGGAPETQGVTAPLTSPQGGNITCGTATVGTQAKIRTNAFTTSPHLYVDRWDTPILCIHGEKDYRILHSQGQAAFSAARMHGIPAELLLFPDENHWVLKPQNGILWQRTFFRWLDKWLK